MIGTPGAAALHVLSELVHGLSLGGPARGFQPLLEATDLEPTELSGAALTQFGYMPGQDLRSTHLMPLGCACSLGLASGISLGRPA